MVETLDKHTDLAHIKALIADDTGSMRGILRTLLSSVGITQIDAVNNGQAAISAINTKTYHIVICDWEMPGVTGIDVLKYVRENERTKKLPFIMCTSGNSKEHLAEAVKCGVNDYLIKPFSQKKFESKITAILDKQLT